MRADITACICTRNRYELLRQALSSLCRQSIGARRCRILVIDSSTVFAPIDNLRGGIGRHRIRHVQTRAESLSESRNLALRLCRTPIIAFMDDDAVASERWLEELAATFARHPRAAAVGGPVAPIWPGDAPGWLTADMLGYYSVVDLGGSERPVTPPEWLAGTNFSLRVAAAREAGGFDRSLGRRGSILLGNEELELCRRLSDAGYESVYSPRAAMQHRIGAERCSREWLRRRIAWQAVSDALMLPDERPDREARYSELDEAFERLGGAVQLSRIVFRDTEDFAAFEQQCRVIRELLALLVR